MAESQKTYLWLISFNLDDQAACKFQPFPSQDNKMRMKYTDGLKSEAV